VDKGFVVRNRSHPGEQFGDRLAGEGGGEGACQVGQSVAALLATRLQHAQQGLYEAVPRVALCSKTEFPPDHRVSQRTLGVIVGRRNP